MFSVLRNLGKMRHHQPRAQLSILCRGKPIGRDDLFAYTNGRFLVDEQRQLGRRYVKFDLDALCNVAAAVGDDSSPIASIEKMEGGFSKALLMKKENGIEVIAKIPCRIAGPASLTTASEVGVLEYVRKHTGIPVPRVLSWSSDSANPVGAEYIIMEKAAGVPLFQKWPDMAEIEKLELIKNLTKLEAQLSAIRFPAYGGLYLRADARDPKSHYQMLDDSIDASNAFCIGPSCDRSFHVEPAADSTQPSIGGNQGPWATTSQLGISIAKRELSRIPTSHSNRPAMFYQGSVDEQTQLLQSTISLMPMLDSHPTLSQTGQPTLWHTDLHMGNIYVAPDDSTRIVSIIDFQSVSVMPAFLQARWPEFLKPPQDYTAGLVHPKLPDGFDDMDEESKMLARREWSQAKVAKAYEVSTYLEDRPAHNAMHVPRVFRELFTRCGEVSEVGIIPLRACLIEIFQNWSSLGFTGSCPFSFTAEDISTHEAQFNEYQAWHEVQRLAQECLDTDAEGWVAPQLDIAEKRRQNSELLTMFIARMADEKSPEEARKMWPFPAEA
ncbi:phosphotransferase enzyme family protein [Aspergillus sclerotiicarbonarius CBS 121057]|uniref:Altered inheritance of mitochondria protein 9, mitochondrial n=1 Tax=Aspergillus sclerotiicarbonarius (strain CBS 121057 / IBT 28362) TaxID=1448318 RepID=A0A319DXR2_ASPSB|nr:phosphotransferase enzyme family protein [Aspergillus sclerotiicarbonarius CBS 121057]